MRQADESLSDGYTLVCCCEIYALRLASYSGHVRSALYAGDFSHATGAVRIPKALAAAPEENRPWRSGMLTVLKQALVEKSRLDDVEGVIYGSRHLTPHLFDFVWRQCLSVLESHGEHEVCQKLTRHYLQLDHRGLYTASWCSSRLQPGSACGSQPQAIVRLWVVM